MVLLGLDQQQFNRFIEDRRDQLADFFLEGAARMTRHLLVPAIIGILTAPGAARAQSAVPPAAQPGRRAPAGRAAAGGRRGGSALQGAPAVPVAGGTSAREHQRRDEARDLRGRADAVPVGRPHAAAVRAERPAAVPAAERHRRRVRAARPAYLRSNDRATNRGRKGPSVGVAGPHQNRAVRVAAGRERRVLRRGAAAGTLARAGGDRRGPRSPPPRNERARARGRGAGRPTLRRSKRPCSSAGRTTMRFTRAGSRR